MKQINNNLYNIRHSLAHILASAVQNLFPGARLGTGPAIENGFYYDLDSKHRFSEQDFKKIEAEMRNLIKQNLKFEYQELNITDAKKFFKQKNETYKVKLIEKFAKDSNKKLSIYKTGNFIDLCEGGHVKNTKELPQDAFKLTRIAGTYWQGNENNPQLQRIYGLAFETKNELKKYQKNLEEARARDHKILGPKLDLFFFHETAPGIPYFLPKGVIIINTLINFWRKEHQKKGYQEISSPLINKKELWEKSGHWKHYKNDMFLADMGENEIYGVKPMNCPNSMIVFESKLRSYRDLPLRLSDTDILHRYERSGTLNGLLRARSFRQDDSHNFVTEDQIEKEYENIFEIAKEFYAKFNLKFKYRLSTRPDKFMGDKATWDKAESSLKHILIKSVGKNGFYIEQGDGAFYGPKVDIIMKDSLNREWQMGTIQLDFQIPKNFDLKYTDKNGKQKTPIVIHRVIYGSLERFIGILIEHFAGAFPFWLAPVQIQILPISEKFNRYAEKIMNKLQEKNFRVEINKNQETLGKKIRQGEIQKIPYLIIVGEKEQKNKTINIRSRENNYQKEMRLNDFSKTLK
ncbi:MAG: Threonine-tRNA ligase [Parcubacteria group bacterium GW2011_GWA2_31_28]|nr:MAG: Threonine-tRNA ligase [Parcubacteria group bacterium GW2011_GWA2_31_28]